MTSRKTEDDSVINSSVDGARHKVESANASCDVDGRLLIDNALK